MMGGKIRALLVAMAVIAVIGIAYVFLTKRPLAVPVAAVERNVPVRVYGLGTVEARIVSKIGFEVGGALADLSVDSGDVVVRGQVLARLHRDAQQARVARAQAGIAAAAANTIVKALAPPIRSASAPPIGRTSDPANTQAAVA